MALVPPSSCPPFFPASPPSIDSSSSPPSKPSSSFAHSPCVRGIFPAKEKGKKEEFLSPPKKEGREENRKCPLRREGRGRETFRTRKNSFSPSANDFHANFSVCCTRSLKPASPGVRRARPPPPRVPPPKFLHVSPSSASRPIRHTYVASLVGRSVGTNSETNSSIRGSH